MVAIWVGPRPGSDDLTPWIDLSTGVNPWPYPIGAVRDDAWIMMSAGNDHMGIVSLVGSMSIQATCALGSSVSASGIQGVS